MKVCLDCGKQKSRKGEYCKKCVLKYRKKSGFKKGHKFYAGGEKGWFKKGIISWNKGLKTGIPVNFKGENVGYYALHDWVYRWGGVPVKCENCGGTKKVQWANKSGKYIRDLEDWMTLCYWCHRKYDRKNIWGLATIKYKL